MQGVRAYNRTKRGHRQPPRSKRASCPVTLPHQHARRQVHIRDRHLCRHGARIAVHSAGGAARHTTFTSVALHASEPVELSGRLPNWTQRCSSAGPQRHSAVVHYTCPMRSAARAAARALRRPWWPRRLRQQRTLGRRVVAVAIVATSIGAAHPVADILHRTQLGGPYCQQQLRVCLRWKGVGGRAGSSREQLCRHSRRARGGPPVNEPTGCPAALH